MRPEAEPLKRTCDATFSVWCPKQELISIVRSTEYIIDILERFQRKVSSIKQSPNKAKHEIIVYFFNLDHKYYKNSSSAY